jgi:hypothetical protein
MKDNNARIGCKGTVLQTYQGVIVNVIPCEHTWLAEGDGQLGVAFVHHTSCTHVHIEEAPTPHGGPPANWTEAARLRKQAMADDSSIGHRVATPAEYWGRVFADAGYNREPYRGLKVNHLRDREEAFLLYRVTQMAT